MELIVSANTRFPWSSFPGCQRSRRDVLALEVEADRLELARERPAGPGRVVGDEAEAVTFSRSDRGVGGAGHRLARNVQDAVDVQQNRGHRTRVYSGAQPAGDPRRGDRLPLLALSGPGGQHAQKTETRVEALFDVDASDTLSDAQKARLRQRLGSVVGAVAQDERSRTRNRELALDRLAAAIRAGLRVERKRRATKPTTAARERRLDEKKRRGTTKRLRQAPDED